MTQNMLSGSKLSEFHTGYRAFSRAVPEPLPLLENSDDFVFDNQMLVQAVAAGQSFACALTTAGGVVCWGRNDFGQLGDGTTTNRLTPVGVSGLSTGVLAIAVSNYHSCAVANTGAAKCWGRFPRC